MSIKDIELKMYELYKKNHSDDYIATEANIPVSTVEKWRKYFSLPKNEKTPDEIYEEVFGRNTPITKYHIEYIEDIVGNPKIRSCIKKKHMNRIDHAMKDLYKDMIRVERLIAEAGIEDLSSLCDRLEQVLTARNGYDEDRDIASPVFQILFELAPLGSYGTGGISVDRKPTEKELEEIKEWLTGFTQAEIEKYPFDYRMSEGEIDEVYCEAFNQIQEFLVTDLGFRIAEVQETSIIVVKL